MQSASALQSQTPPLDGMRILVVEDNLHTADLVKQTLVAAGAQEVALVADDAMGLAILADFRPDVLVTDRMAPEADGVAMVASVRRAALQPDAGVPNPAVPIVLLSGCSGQGAVWQARNAGIDAYVVKPFSFNSLVKRVERAGKRKVAFIVSDDYVGPDRGAVAEARPADLAQGPALPTSDPSLAGLLKTLYDRIRELEERQKAS